MEGLGEIRKLETYLFTEQGSKTSSDCFRNMDADRKQTLDRTGSDGDSVGAGHEFQDGKLPPISTFFSQPAHQYGAPENVRSTASGGDWVRSETHAKPKQVGEAGEEPLLVDPTYETLNRDSNQPAQTSASYDKDADRVINFTIPPSEEDLRLLQSFQEKNGYVKRPMNAFLVWSHIHRCTLKKQNQGLGKKNISTQLGHEWSNLSKEEKRPYFEMAYKIKRIHQQKFPEYVFRPEKKKSIESLSAGQRTGADTSLSASRPGSLVQSEFQGPGVKTCPDIIPYIVGYHHCPFLFPHIPIDLCSSPKIQCASYPHACCSIKEAEKNHNSCPQRDKQEVMIGSTTTSESHKQADIVTSQQVLLNDVVHECDDYIDVDGLLSSSRVN